MYLGLLGKMYRTIKIEFTYEKNKRNMPMIEMWPEGSTLYSASYSIYQLLFQKLNTVTLYQMNEKIIFKLLIQPM